MRSRTLLPLAALAALVALGVGGFRLWTLANAPSRVPEVAPDDDLAMLETFVDAGAPGVRDLLAVGSGRLFVAHGTDGTLDVQPAAGGASTVLARVGAPVAGLAVGTDALWVTSGHAVRRVPLDGGPPVVASDRLQRPHAIAVDGTSVFVVDVDPTPQGMLQASRVVRLPAGASPGDAGPAEAVVVGRYQGEVSGVVLDHGGAFWTDPLEGAVLGLPPGAPAPTVLATERGLPGAVTVVGDQVVWVEKRSESLWAVARAGGTPRQLVQDFAGFAHLVAHGRRVAWVNEAAVEGKFRVLEVPIEGGDVVAVSPAEDAIDALASDGDRLYWLRDGVARPVDAGD